MHDMVGWNRIVRFIAQEDSKEYIGEPADEQQDVGQAVSQNEQVKVEVLSSTSVLDLTAKKTGDIKTIKKLLSPISRQEVGTIRCIGLNYRDHAKELKLEIPAVPTLFFKPDTCLTDPLSNIVIPHHATDLEADYEAELTIVIGTTCTNLKSFEEASACILGYTLSNDVTARKHQFQGAQWSYGKGFDTFAPLGPVIVSREYVQSANDKGDICIQSVLNGQVMQTGLLSDTIFSPEHIVHFLSQGTTLPAGTVILTGTPHGIGVSRDPQVFMQDGDVIVIKGTHGLGSLINTVKYDSL